MDNLQFQQAVKDGPQLAWTIKGTLSNGSPYVSRKRVNAPETAFVSEAVIVQTEQSRLGRMTQLGADVRLVKEYMGDDLLWHEFEANNSPT